MASQGRVMWSTESSFNYLEYSRLSPSPLGGSSSTALSPGSPSYQKDDDIQDVLSRGAAPLKAIYVAIVETDEYPQCLMKQDDWDALTGHFGVDHSFVDACMSDGFGSEGKGDGNVRDGRASFWNVSRVARFNPATRATSFLQLGVYITFDLSTRSATLIAVLRGKDPVIVPCWHSPRAGDDPFEVLSPMFKSVVQSWALYFQTHDAVLSASEGSAVTHPDSLDLGQVLDLGKVYSKCKTELKIFERTLEFMRAEHDEYREFRPANPFTREILRSYLCQTKKLIDRADSSLERVSALRSIHLNQNALAGSHATKQVAQQTHTLSQASTRDSISMRTMASIQLCFLPSTFVSAFFSMGFFNSLAIRRAWLFPTVAIPLTLCTIVIWYVWQRNRYKTDTTQNYSMATRPTNSFSAPTKRPQYDAYSRNVAPVNQQRVQPTNGGAASMTKTTESQPQINRLGVTQAAGSSANQTYFTGSSSVTLTKVQSPREEKSDLVSSGSDSIITIRPTNLGPTQPPRGLSHSPDLPNLEKVMSSTSGAPTTSTIPPQQEKQPSPTPPLQQEHQGGRSASTPTPPPQNPAIQRVSQDLKRHSGHQQPPRPSMEATNRKSVDQTSVVAPSVAGSDWFTS